MLEILFVNKNYSPCIPSRPTVAKVPRYVQVLAYTYVHTNYQMWFAVPIFDTAKIYKTAIHLLNLICFRWNLEIV